MAQRWIAIGAALMALAVVTGAFGAHGLKGRLDAYGFEVYHKATFYHFVHAIGILIVAQLMSVLPEAALQRVNLFLLVGIILFSGSLYTLALSGVRWLGAITPFGGTAFIIGWVWLAVVAIRSRG